MYRIPPYVDCSLFEDKEVLLGEEPWVVPGTLAVPKHFDDNQGLPAVVLVHGTGDHDRNGSGSIKPFLDIAWGLASQGIAVLRYEKRSVWHNAQLGQPQTPNDEIVADAIAACNHLATEWMHVIDPEQIFLVGHSLGGMLLPLIGKTLGFAPAGYCLLAAPARPLEDVTLDRLRYLFTLYPTPVNRADLIQATREARHIKRLGSEAIPDDMLLLGMPQTYWKYLIAYDHVGEMAHLKKPVCVMQGGKDYYVTEDDFKIWCNTQHSTPESMWSFFPNLNHVFIEVPEQANIDEAPGFLEYLLPQLYEAARSLFGEQKKRVPKRGTPADAAMQGHVAPFVVDKIACWIQRIVFYTRRTNDGATKQPQTTSEEEV